MKFLHTADLHIGKSLFEFSLLPDQREILRQIREIAQEEQVDAVLIAGDVYDRAVPSAEAVTVLSEFLTALSRSNIPVCLVAGNHDSPERIGFGAPMLAAGGLYVAGKPGRVTFYDEYGPVNVYLLPFVRPQAAGQTTTGETVRQLLSEYPLPEGERNVLLTHYFVTSQGKLPEQSESEQDFLLGGLDSVDASAFDGFDYVALGHIHRPQRIGRDTVCYAGSPLKYSFSEVNQRKGVMIVEMAEKGKVTTRKRELAPLRDLRCIRGELEELTKAEILSAANREDYIQVTLTDERDLLEPAAVLRACYPNVCQVLFEKRERQEESERLTLQSVRQKTRMEMFREFYDRVSDHEWDEEKEDVIRRVLEEVER